MAAYGMGVVVAPIIGPTLGGWITDSYSWRWIFYINLPLGVLALFMRCGSVRSNSSSTRDRMIYNLMRNIGGSVGIAAVTTLLARGAQVHQSILVGHLSAANPAFQQELSALQQGVTAQQAYGLIYAQLIRQSTLLAYMDNFRLLAGLALAAIPLILLFQRVRRK